MISNIIHLLEISKLENSKLNLSGDFTFRNCTRNDKEKLGELYSLCYQDEKEEFGKKSESLAKKDIDYIFAGDYGEFLLQASLLIENGQQEIVGSILIVHKNTWDESIPHPYIIELFVHPNFRRQALARFLLSKSAKVLESLGHQFISITVNVHNKKAKRLVEDLGFQESLSKI